jgi:tRNA-specific 2-thiouridylase
MTPGEILDTQGRVLGLHSGLANYTIGQRKGIGVSGPRPLYVVEKRPITHQVVVGERSSLGRTSFRLRFIHWIEGHPPSHADGLTVQVRYRAAGVPARIESEAHSAMVVRLSEPLPDIAPGQLAVFYDGDHCLGSGDILE